jgi:hypothetical protein
MKFSMKMTFVDVICNNSLENLYANGNRIGFTFGVRLGYYRGHWLSCIDELRVKVDGVEAPQETIRFGLNGKEFSVPQLGYCRTEFWPLLEPARITVLKQGGLAEGRHSIEFDLMLRIPYMPLGGEHNYMPLDSCENKELAVKW